VARAVGLSPSTLCAWESAGLSTPQRDAWRRRWYTAAETDRLHEIRLLRDKQRLSLRDIHHHLVERDGNGAEERSPSHTEHRIAQRLKSMRNQLGLTVRQVAERTGLSSSYVSSVENGYTRSVAGLWKLSQAYRANILSFHRTIAGATAAAGSRRAGGSDRYGRSRVGVALLTPHEGAIELHLFERTPGANSGGSYRQEGTSSATSWRGHWGSGSTRSSSGWRSGIASPSLARTSTAS
jgi:transcriptional regulator with XRE-family HTH domain